MWAVFQYCQYNTRLLLKIPFSKFSLSVNVERVLAFLLCLFYIEYNFSEFLNWIEPSVTVTAITSKVLYNLCFNCIHIWSGSIIKPAFSANIWKIQSTIIVDIWLSSWICFAGDSLPSTTDGIWCWDWWNWGFFSGKILLALKRNKF